MENSPSDLKRLVEELSKGKELAKQLQMHLSSAQSSSSSSHEFLIDRIMYSYDQTISILINGGNFPPPESPAGSPRSDDSDQEVKDQASRKVVPRWIQKVKVRPGKGIEEQLDDGYSWRKYGQKDILGAKHPRGYYRCTHRHNQNCLATKQVQRSDDDPTILEVTYRRKHTCNPHAYPTNKNNSSIAIPDPPNHEDPNPLPENPQQSVPESHQNQQIGPLFNIQTSLSIVPQDLGTNENLPSFNDPFNFPSSSSSISENYNIFSDILGNYPDNILPNFHTSESNYFPISTALMDGDYRGFIPSLHTSDSEFNQIVAPVTSVADSPTLSTRF